MSIANLLLPFTCNFHYSQRIVVIFFTAIIHMPHRTAQMIDSEEQVCLLADVLIYLRLMHNDFVCLYFTLVRAPNVMEFVWLYAAVVYSLFMDEGKEQRLVAASCVFPRNAMLSSPLSFLICALLQVRTPSFVYFTGACTLWSGWQYCN